MASLQASQTAQPWNCCTRRLWAGSSSNSSTGSRLPRGAAPPGTRPPRRQRRQPGPPLPGALPEAASALAMLASSSYVDPSLAADTFEPQMRPEIVVAAAVAATPPIVFWARIFLSAQRRQQAIDAERAAEEQRQQEREELKRKITGQASKQ